MPRKKKPIDLAKVEMYAQLGMTTQHIAHLVGLSPSVFYDRMAKKPEIQETIDRGRATSAALLAQTVMKHAVLTLNPKTGQPVVPVDARLAIEALKKFAPLWKDNAQVEIHTTGQTTINQAQVVADELGDAAMQRMTKMYLKSRGYEVKEPK